MLHHHHRRRAAAALAPFLLLAFVSLLFRCSSLDVSRFHLSRLRPGLSLPPPSPSSSASAPPRCAAPDPLAAFPLRPVPPHAPPSLARYAAWHAAARRCLADRSCPHKPPVLLFHCLAAQSCGGLGDRLRGIHLTFLIAVATRRLFLIDIPAGEHSAFPLSSALHPVSIDWRPPFPPSPLPPQNTPQPQPRPFRRLALASTHAPNDTLLLNWAFTDYDTVVVPRPSANYSHFFAAASAVDHLDLVSQTARDARRITAAFASLPPFVRIACNAPHAIAWKLFSAGHLLADAAPELRGAYTLAEVLRHVTHALFAPAPAVAALVADAVFFGHEEEEEGDGGQLGYVAVHARTGGDVEEGDRPRFKEMARNYTAVTAALLDCVVRRGATRGGLKRVFLASDSTEFKGDFVRLATQRYGMTVRTLRERAVHVGKMNYDGDDDAGGHAGGEGDGGVLTSGVDGENRKCKDFLNVFVDVAAMARSQMIVSTGSGFSKTAFFIGTQPTALYIGYSTRGKGPCTPDTTAMRKR